MTLYCKKSGEGEPLIFLSGWGFHHRIWDHVVEKLSQHYECWQLDLPGIGWSPHATSYYLDGLLENLSNILPENFTLCGWSLGGMIAMAFTEHYPERVKRLITVASNPKFIATEEWPGVAPDVMMKFFERLTAAPIKTLREFVLLQCQGNDNARAWFKTLNTHIEEGPEPHLDALTFGLDLLKNLDQRDALHTLAIPQWHIYGRLDALVPQDIAQRIPNSEVFTRSAHMPFLTELERFCDGVLS